MNEEEKKRAEEEEQSEKALNQSEGVDSTVSPSVPTEEDQAQPENEPIADGETETDIQAQPEEGQSIPHQDGESNGESDIAPTEPEPAPEKMLTQSQVNELVGRARQEGRESAMRELYGRYGVSNDEEMNDVFGRGQTYAALDDEYNKQKESMVQLMTENALLKSNIDAARWDDVKYILKGKGYEVTPENIEAEIASHPEWRTVTQPTAVAPATTADQNQPQSQAQQQQPPTVLRRLGSEATVKDDGSTDTEEDRVRNLFGM